jgi:hypothetical protein
MQTQACVSDPEIEVAPSRRDQASLRVLGLALLTLLLSALTLFAYRQPELTLNWVYAVLC